LRAIPELNVILGPAEDARFWVKMRLPMAEPCFSETVQIGIVVRDLEATMRRYVDEYGIGPWEIHEFTAGNAEGLQEHGRPVERSWRLATTMVGRVQWELIEPRDDASDYARFLAERGEGVHHVAVAPTNYDRALAEEAKRGRETVLSGTFSGYRVAYLPTERDLGVIVEIFSDDRAPEQKPEAG
jgi:glyoxalase/bleomycin resistance protein/dioxygenase superfamily protein